LLLGFPNGHTGGANPDADTALPLLLARRPQTACYAACSETLCRECFLKNIQEIDIFLLIS